MTPPFSWPIPSRHSLARNWDVGGTPYYDLALFDTGAAATLITHASDAAFNIAGAGFRGTETQPIGGATGFFDATINNPMAIYATGLANRTVNRTARRSILPPSSASRVFRWPRCPPNPICRTFWEFPSPANMRPTFATTSHRSFRLNGQTVRTPQIQFLTLGSGGQGITRRVPITLDDPSAFASPPIYIFNILNVLNGGSTDQ